MTVFNTRDCSRCGEEVPNPEPIEDGSIVCDSCLEWDLRQTVPPYNAEDDTTT